MCKKQTKQAIIKRLNSLNKKIDLKIINGCDYKKEAQEHKNLYLYLQDILLVK